MRVDVELNAASQFVTAYVEGKPVATLIRARVYDKSHAWRCYDLAGDILFQTMFGLTAKSAARRIEWHLKAGLAS